MKHIADTIIWDWNGTLLNDTDICLEGINRLLTKRKLPELSREKYRNIFTFPVRDYYLAAGFDFKNEPFEIPAQEFIIEYKSLLQEAVLFDDVFSTLTFFRQKGLRQFIVSAMEQNALEISVKERGISGFFEKICGIEDNLAFSKLHRGKALIQQNALNPEKTVMVGDTLHDFEVAGELGIKILLVARGHQHHARLEKTGCPVFENFSQLLKYMNGHP